MTPANSDYFKSDFKVKISKDKISNILRERYQWMLKQGQKLELHLHLSIIMNNMNYKEQARLFEEAISWMKKELGVTPKEFVPGWWSYNNDTLALCKRFKLKMIYPKDYDFIHDYNWILQDFIEIIKNNL